MTCNVHVLVATLGAVALARAATPPNAHDHLAVTAATATATAVAPESDFWKFGIYGDKAPQPKTTTPVVTQLPLALRPGDRVVFIGNTLFDRGADYPHFEASLQVANPELKLVVRTLAWSADEVDLMPRPANFGDLHQHLAVQKADVIFAAFGFNESFGGIERLPDFRRRLATFLGGLKTRAYNGHTGPRIVLVSPIANENVKGVPAADMNNARLRAYTEAMAEVAAEQKVGFANVFEATKAALDDPKTDLTFNGVHLEDTGYAMFADRLFRAVFGRERPNADPGLVTLVADKNRQFFRRYRPLNGFYYTGGRNKDYGYLDFLPAMRGFDVMVQNRDERTWEVAAGKTSRGARVDDSNVPPMPPPLASRGANEWLTPAAELAAFKIDPRFEVNLFASEEEFPEVAKPIQMRWDTKGRLWISCSTTYPHVYPGREPADRIVILEDTDQDGRADKCSVFAENLHIPLSFELADDGVYVSEQPNLTFLKDTDGDGRADFRRQIFTGFGTEDSHHSLHDFIRTPDGDLLFRESIFLHSQVETAYGPVRSDNSSWFRLRTDTQRLTAFGSYPNTNPWGVAFDDWGRHVASHPIYANAFHATNPPYPKQHVGAGALPAYSGTCGHEFVDAAIWPKEMQGGMIKARYKPTNRIEIHEWVQQGDHFEERYVTDMIFSTNLSFIPVDVKFGPRGDLYICDWYNPIKGHMQYSLRDERRDRRSGRIWRLVPKGAPLPAAPVFSGASITTLLDLLKAAPYRHRDLAKRELAGRDRAEVARALTAWVAALDPKDPRFRHHQLEALWTYRTMGALNTRLLEELLGCEMPDARAAATQQLRYWHAQMPSALERLRAAANDESGLVRMEAVIAASYIGTAGALDAVLGVLAKPADSHLRYAIRTSLESEALARHWNGNEAYVAAHPEIPKFIKAQTQPARNRSGVQTTSPADTRFDQQRNLKTIEIATVPERMLFDVTRFEVKAGQPVKLVFRNPDAMQHNLVIVRPGALEEVGMAGNEMAKDPDGIKRNFVPNSEKVLHATKLIDPNTSVVMRFTAPKDPGNYPYVCTFPGHWVIMNGIMQVTP
ncbi:MAG: GDSL-type esterase/lipase family protein [Opitutaceae bacterium]|nr:GDSL-type esterase/lipase family protein [Opitutaceae bacterium]